MTNIDAIVNEICGAYPETESARQDFTRGLCAALADHYIGMSIHEPFGGAWMQANSGWSAVYNTALKLQRIAQLAGSAALDFADVEQLAGRVKAACNAAGYVAKS